MTADEPSRRTTIGISVDPDGTQAIVDTGKMTEQTL